MAATQSSLPSTPSDCSVASSRASSHLAVFTDIEEKEASQTTPLLTPKAPPTPSSPTGRHRSPSPQPPSSVVSSSHLSVTDIPPMRTRRSSSSVGKIICDLLPEKLVVPHSPSPQRTPSSEDAPSASPSSSAQRTPLAQGTPTAGVPSTNVRRAAVPVIQTSGTEVSPPSTITTTASTPQASGLFPRVVIVNPTPHPTPPATPQMPANPAPFVLPHTSTTLLPPAHPLARAINPSQLKSEATVTAPEPVPAKANEETLKASDRRRFFLHSESPDQDSPERPSASPASDETAFEDIGEEDVVESGSVMSHSSVASAVSSRSRQSHARESATSRRGAGAGAKGRKGKEAVRHAPQRPTLHRMHTAGGARTGHLTVTKRSQSAANVQQMIGMERTKSAGSGAAKAPAAVERTKSAGVKVKSPTTPNMPATSARSEEGGSGKGKGKAVPEEAVRNSPTNGRAKFMVGSASSNGTDSVVGNASPVGQAHVFSGVQLGAGSDGNPRDAQSAAPSPSRAAPPPPSQPAPAPKPVAQVVPPSQTQSRPESSAQPQKTQTAAPAQPSTAAKQSSSSPQQQPTSQRRGLIISTSSEYETTDSEGEEDDSWESEEVSDHPPARAQNHRYVDQNKRTAAISAATREQIRIQEAAREAQRQRDMFAKLPKRSYSNLQRTQSGLLSQLLNPDPTIFPPEHPYRRSTEDVAAKARGFSMTSLGMTPARAVAPAPKLQTSKSSASIAEAAPVQAQAQVTVPHAGPSNRQHHHQQPPQGNGAYRPKGMPKEEELEYDTDSDEEDGENGIQVSTSLAQQKLAALVGPHRRTSSGQQQQQQQRQPAPQPSRPPVPPNVANRQLPERPPPPPAASRVQTDPNPSRPDRPVLSTVHTAPIPLNHPYNLPAPPAPMTPRTTRRKMLATELSESLRRNLLWERQVSLVPRRGGGLLGGGLRPLTSTTPRQVQAQAQPLMQQQQQQQQAGGNGQQAQHGQGSRPLRSREEEREERRRQAMARNRSWADDYHYSGW
ncbi:hypothetical protein OE88DRAFT_1736811 [Heliocybe sulcata]|uniref:DUF3295 domain-containing protein n=1 Tax=Heliocybe sulcata TaxID=5364 RepID=A0A5C3N1C7_9AGAM|nr:hypothetical protein OE88DRAFT_1736811 [Heliocybe sulcata]